MSREDAVAERNQDLGCEKSISVAHLDIEVCRVTEDGADVLCLGLHIDLLDFTRFCVCIRYALGVLSKSSRESGLVSVLEGCRESSHD